MRRLAWLFPMAFFFLNPNLGCGGPEFQYGAAEMRAALEGDWLLTFSPEGGQPSQVTLRLEQRSAASAPEATAEGRGLLRQAQACGIRSLLKSAGACTDSTEMPLDVTIVGGDQTFANGPLAGRFTVHGLTFGSGQVEVTLGELFIGFTLASDGIPRDVRSSGLPGMATIVHTRS